MFVLDGVVLFSFMFLFWFILDTVGRIRRFKCVINIDIDTWVPNAPRDTD